MTALPIDPERYAIQTRALHLWYGDRLALDGVSLDIRRGSITALIGPSGCGKTTLLRCMNRLNERFEHTRTSGEIFVLGKNIRAPDVSLGELRRYVGMVFQRPNPLPLSIYENVMFGLRVHYATGDGGRMTPDDIVESALRSVALWDDTKDRLRASALSLSLEQQQKLCIARLLPLKPQVILMDEPCSALDARGTEAIEALIAGLTPACTVVIVTHNMAQARRASDQCVFMLLGKVVEQGDTVELFLRPTQRETELYVEGRYG
jgi:phosphate transport system ATP-binding protein